MTATRDSNHRFHSRAWLRLGGFVLEGGQLLALWHPTEVLIIVGAALGAFLTSNPPKVVKAAFTGAIDAVKGPRYKREDYVALLKLLYDILMKIRKEGLMAIEADLETPDGRARCSRNIRRSSPTIT